MFTFLIMNSYLILLFCLSHGLIKGIVAQKPQGLEVICPHGCNPAYIDFELTLKVTCNGRPCPIDQNVQWSMHPIPQNFIWNRDVIAFDNAETIIINVKPDAFKENDTVRFMALIGGESAEKHIEFKSKSIAFELNCVPSCNEDADPTVDYVITAKCQKGCSLVDPKMYNWLISPETEEKSQVIIKREKLTIKANAYKGGTDVFIIFEVGESKLYHKIQFRYMKPNLVINCNDNCEEFSVMKPTTLEVTCTDACVSKDFVWTIIPATNNLSVTGQNKKQLTLLENAFTGGINVTTSVTQGGLGKARFSFITKGNISIEPASGFSGITKFRINHDYPPGIIMAAYQKIPKDTEKYGVLLYEGIYLADTDLFLADGEPANLIVLVKDFKQEFYITASVKGITSMVPGETIKQTIKRKILQKTEDTLPFFIEQNDWAAFAQMAAILLIALSQTTGSFSEHYRHHVLQEINNAAGEMDPQQVITLLVRAVESIDDLSSKTSTSHMIADSLMQAAQRIVQRCCRYSEEELNRIATDIMSLASVLSRESSIVRQVIEQQESVRFYEDYSEMAYTRAKELDHVQATTYSTIKAIEAVGYFLDMNKKPVVLAYSNDMASSTQYLHLKPEIVKVYKVASYLSISGQLAKELSRYRKPVGHIASVSPNPFWWHPIGKTMDTEILMVNVFHDMDKVGEMGYFLDIYLKIQSNNSRQPITGYFHEKSSISQSYRFKTHIGTKIEIYSKFVNQDYFVLLSFYNPSFLDIREKGWRMSKGREYSKIFTADKPYFFLGIATFSGYKPRYEISVTATRCHSWNIEDTTWTTNHCKVGRESVPGYIHCQCNHLSLFAASIFVPPNKIMDLSDITLREAITRSYVVIIFLAIVIAAWGVLMVYATRRDNELNDAVGAVLSPADTIPGDRHLYLTCIETGSWVGAGTSSHVAIQLIGRNASSRIHLIHGPGRLGRGGEDWWAIFTPNYLGVILFVRLFHDSYGRRPDWFCQGVTVQHPSSRRVYSSIVGRWFSLLKDDGQVERYIPFTRKKHISGKALFPMVAQEHFRDEHLLFSVFIRPPGSSFTSKERITVAFTTLLVAMLSAAMFFGLTDKNSIDSKPRYGISLYELIIIIEDFLITFPVVIILIIIFRRSRPFPKETIHSEMTYDSKNNAMLI